MSSMSMAPTFGTVFPQRFLYSQDEITANPNAPVTTLFQKTDVNNNNNILQLIPAGYCRSDICN